VMDAMNHGISTEKQLREIEKALQEGLIANGVSCAMLIDSAGNTIAQKSVGDVTYDTYAFAALAAGNYATVDSLARLVGEEEFDQLYHRGEKTSIHFGKISNELLLITIFDREVSLGFLRLKVTELRETINRICQEEPARNTGMV